MNFSAVGKILGLLLLLLTAGMVIPLGIASYDFVQQAHDPAATKLATLPLLGILTGISMGLLISMALLFLNRQADTNVGKSEAILLVFLSWSLGSVIAAFPFFFWARFAYEVTGLDSPFRNLINCVFETVSGLTTTGASILTDIPSIPDSLLFWRALLQWYGGLGIVVLFVAILPMIAGGNKKLFSAEATGITKDGSTPKIQETARSLWLIYCGFTAFQVILMLMLDPELSVFSAITFAFSTAATAGFSVLNESAGTMLPSVQWVMILFMMIAGVNYGLYYQFFQGKWRDLFNDIEFRAYVAIILTATAIIALTIHGHNYVDMNGQEPGGSIEQTLRDAAFQVVSILTTTGFSNADSDMWPQLCQLVLVSLMFIGGCGGSTGGGIKVIRIVSSFKLFFAQLEKVYRPNVVRPIKLGRHIIQDHMKIAILLHILAVILLAFLGAVMLIIIEPEIDGVSAFTASIATLNNIGPGFSMVGATQNYSWLSDMSKVILTLWMLIGRLEVFTVLVIFSPRFWKQA
ncbi:TrkH family potassium uptake protein [Pseudobacteriovorax antillogorgiicola]|uniref:Trk system potassium uptake protein TrkH n=1 Tax=Pseudobacteriovorax antillogorgiicola TaxID=1513793 RepID=A0A1Y6BSV5_9BACT|nr:potassium transporter TrkG [Pseudobacteriovorax antillogorgiicola]TCS53149.1 trk system potassium uptake protein TrkH [Pseudobacteriovorax antillogorgiicola]SMF25185.1 trk system potassium uptake protein TrkH [Pseudobacteriovorax antillogorgiicola]